MEKIRNRKQVAYTIDREIIKLFNKRAKELSINKSALIENLVRKWMKENEKK